MSARLTSKMGGVAVETQHALDRRIDMLLRGLVPFRGREDKAGAERLRQDERIAGLRSRLRQDFPGMDNAHDGESVLRLLVDNGVAARDDAARFRHLIGAAAEDLGDDLWR